MKVSGYLCYVNMTKKIIASLKCFVNNFVIIYKTR